MHCIILTVEVELSLVHCAVGQQDQNVPLLCHTVAQLSGNFLELVGGLIVAMQLSQS